MPDDSPVDTRSEDAHPTDPAPPAGTAPEAGTAATPPAPNGAPPGPADSPSRTPSATGPGDRAANGRPLAEPGPEPPPGPARSAGAGPEAAGAADPGDADGSAVVASSGDGGSAAAAGSGEAGGSAGSGDADDSEAAGGGGGGKPPARRWPGRRRGRPEKKRGSFIRELPVLLITAFGLALLIKTFLVQAFFIPSGSMEKTLHGCPGCSGDRVLVNKVVYRLHDPHQGDVVVFRGPESWASEAQFAKPSNPVTRVLRGLGSAIGIAPAGEKDFVKRVIAVGGQTVECCDGNGRILVDDSPLDEPYVYTTDPEYRPAPFGPVKVPEGRLWMMGDHRDESADSRVHIADSDQGTIGVSDVIGKAFVIVWPPSRWDTLGTPSTFASAAAPAAPLLLGLTVAVPPWALRRRRRRGR
jgi:signal peptidase I